MKHNPLYVNLSHMAIAYLCPSIILHPQYLRMKAILAPLILLALLAAQTSSQQNLPSSVYTPFTQEEVLSVTTETETSILPPRPEGKHHPKKHRNQMKHGGLREDHPMSTSQDEIYGSDLTDQEREQRRMERKRYNKIFKVGMIIGSACLAVIVFKFCKAKRIRNRNRMIQAQQQVMVPQQQPYLYPIGQPVPVNPHAYPSFPAQQVQVGRPYQQPPMVRGRVHDSFIPQAPVVENPLQAQIRFHQTEIQRLRQMRERGERREREIEMQRVPINTTESFESQRPIHRYRNVPVGQPVYPKDANSSFASEYPEI